VSSPSPPPSPQLPSPNRLPSPPRSLIPPFYRTWLSSLHIDTKAVPRLSFPSFLLSFFLLSNLLSRRATSPSFPREFQDFKRGIHWGSSHFSSSSSSLLSLWSLRSLGYLNPSIFTTHHSPSFWVVFHRACRFWIVRNQDCHIGSGPRYNHSYLSSHFPLPSWSSCPLLL